MNRTDEHSLWVRSTRRCTRRVFTPEQDGLGQGDSLLRLAGIAAPEKASCASGHRCRALRVVEPMDLCLKGCVTLDVLMGIRIEGFGKDN